MPVAQPGQRFGGRSKGALNKRTAALRAIADKAIETGITPLEVMLTNMRFYVAEIEKLLASFHNGKTSPAELPRILKTLVEFRDKAQACAVDAAPYVHPKLASHTISGDPNAPLEVVHIIEHVVTSDSVHKIERARSDRVPATIEAGPV